MSAPARQHMPAGPHWHWYRSVCVSAGSQGRSRPSSSHNGRACSFTPSPAYKAVASARGAGTSSSVASDARTRQRLLRGTRGSPPADLVPRRQFHDYFVTHLPSTSMHPDSRGAAGPSHKLPRSESTPHEGDGQTKPLSPASVAPGHERNTTVVRIPLKSAKHHYGASCARGSRPYNEDTYQAGTIELPAFARRAPMSLSDRRKSDGEVNRAAEGASGDPQVFYFGVFDGHGGDKCSIWLRERLHEYLEEAAVRFGLCSTLETDRTITRAKLQQSREEEEPVGPADHKPESTQSAESAEEVISEYPQPKEPKKVKTTEDLQADLVKSWKDVVGGYFRRFKPEFFSASAGGQGEPLAASVVRHGRLEQPSTPPSTDDHRTAADPSIATVLSYAFLRADLDFITALSSQEHSESEPAEPSLGRHVEHGTPPFLGGSTCSVALISTPTPTPFWAPSSPFTIITAHLGDTRILLCSAATGAAVPLTDTHHPATPSEATRLRRYAGAFTTDSFGEERLAGLANTRAFGDRRSKRIGVSAEPALRLLHARPGEFSFLALVSDGVTAALSDDEVVDVVKEARTPEQAARDVVALATELMSGEQGDADNATCLVVRLGGWERRAEGGGGGLGTRERREWRRQEASNPRAGRM